MHIGALQGFGGGGMICITKVKQATPQTVPILTPTKI